MRSSAQYEVSFYPTGFLDQHLGKILFAAYLQWLPGARTGMDRNTRTDFFGGSESCPTILVEKDRGPTLRPSLEHTSNCSQSGILRVKPRMNQNTYKYDTNWHPFPPAGNSVLAALTSMSGTYTTFHTGALPVGHTKMSGLTGAYYSGYHPTFSSPEGYSVVGEELRVRYGDGIYKQYLHPVASSGGHFYAGPEYKYFDGHHLPSGVCPDASNLAFGNVPWPVICSTSGDCP